jgi:uncharacterized protein (TIGR03083 family)
MMAVMEIDQHIAALRRDGSLLARAAERAGLDAPVPSCPSWQVKDLLRHLGYVHRWAAGYVAEQREQRLAGRPSENDLLSGGPPDAELLGWFRDGHAALVKTLRLADPGVSCWTFLDAPSPLAFWARRQAHETAIHRADAELSAGQLPDYPADFAADGIDELIMGFFARDEASLTAGQRAGPRRSAAVRASDTGGGWLAELTADGSMVARVQRGAGPADCTLTGPAAGLYLLLWNRADLARSGVTVSGDDAVLRAWQGGMRVRWA